jgi:hypothetical protein
VDTNCVFAIKFSSVYPFYIQKVEKTNRTKKEVDQVLCWLTGYTQAGPGAGPVPRMVTAN